VINADVDEAEIVDNVFTGFDSLLKEMKFKEALKRSLWSIPLHLGEGFTIGVKGWVFTVHF
jgi:ATP-dependent DNA helicase 2 subunit 1